MEPLETEKRVVGGIAPGPASSEIPTVFQQLRDDALAGYTGLFQTYGDAVRIALGPRTNHFLFHPEHVKHVLVTAQERYDKETYGNRRLRSFTGPGLLFSEGALWQRQRRLTQPLLASREHDTFAEFIRQALLASMGSWLNTATPTGVTDVQELVARAMFVGIMRALISRELTEQEAVSLRQALGTLLEESQRMTVPKVRDIATSEMDEFSRASALMDSAIMDSILQHHRDPSHSDFLARLMASAAAEQASFSDEELLAQVKTMILAGHDTAAHSVAFALYFLSQRPDLQEQVRAEGKWLSDTAPLAATAARMKHTEAIAFESLRLLPPIWAIERHTRQDDEVMGCLIPKDSGIVLSPYVTHRHPAFWDRPNEFRPERFMSPNPLRHRYAYFPFGGGQRICVGNNVAMLQLKVALATILSHFHVELVADFKCHFQHLVVLRFKHGLPLKLTPLA